MPVPTSINDLSATASSNSPGGGEYPFVLDDHIRALGAIVRQEHDSVQSGLSARHAEIANYAAIRAYTGTSTSFYVRGVSVDLDGGAGVFRVDATDTTSADNGGTILVDTAGRRWKRDFSGFANVRWFGATGDGATDDTAAIQAAIDSGADVFVPLGTYIISSTLHMVKDGQSIRGSSKYNSIVKNTANAARLFQIGKYPDSVGNRGQFCSMQSIRFTGNAATVEGVAILGVVDDALSGAARDVSMSDVRIDGVGAGYALRVSAWELLCEGLTIFTSNKGILLGSECNSSTFINTYITGCTNEAVSMPVSAGQPAVVEFVGLTAQYSGGTNGTVDIGEAYSIKFSGVYLEGNTAPANMYAGGSVKNITIDGVMHNLVSGTATRVIRAVDVKTLIAKNVVNVGGAMESLVRIEGTLPLSFVEGVFVAGGSVSVNEVDDQSTRKATCWKDPLEGRQGTTDFYALTSQSNMRAIDSATGSVLMDMFNGRIYFGAQGAVPNFRRAGSTVSLFSDDGTTYGNFRPLSLTLGSGNVRIFAGINSPEGFQTADAGSIFLRTNGGAGSTLYVKESGSGATGWVAK